MNYMRQSFIFQFEVKPFGKSAQAIAFTMHKALFLMNFLQKKRQNKSKNIFYYDLFIQSLKIYQMR